jgi:hypothetical protein
MTAHKHLEGYMIGGDLIDRLTVIEMPLEEKQNSAGTERSPEPPPAGGTSAGAVVLQNAMHPDGSDGIDKRLVCRREGFFQIFKTGGEGSEMEYRLGGVKPLFVTSLRVNIRAGDGKTSYYDSLDLYTARGRSGFAQAVHRALGKEPARVERDLIKILEYLERERDTALIKGNKEVKRELTAAERELGLELLSDRKLFERIVEDLSSLGYVGEELNKQLLYLCASSRKLDDPISVLILSQSAAGKSFLVDTVKRLMPEEDVVAVTSLSDQALNYIDELTHKFLILGEAVHGDIIEHQIREMLSGKELSRMVTIKDAETGKLQSRIVRTPVIVSSVMGSTRGRINPENASRCFVINADESRGQTARIHDNQRRKYSLEKLTVGDEKVKHIIAQHQAAQRMLQKKTIINDFAQYLDFPTALMRMRRDHDRFLDLIAAVCFLRQYQKKEEYSGNVSFIRCDTEDYEIAYRIMIEGVLSSTMGELPRGAQMLYEDIRSWVRKEAKKQKLEAKEVSFTQRQIREATGLGHTWIKANVRKLVEYDYLELARGRERAKSYYRIRADEDILAVDLSMIPTPGAMKEAARHLPKT